MAQCKQRIDCASKETIKIFAKIDIGVFLCEVEENVALLLTVNLSVNFASIHL